MVDAAGDDDYDINDNNVDDGDDDGDDFVGMEMTIMMTMLTMRTPEPSFRLFS